MVKIWQTPRTAPLAIVEIMINEPREEKEKENGMREEKTETRQTPVPNGHKDVEEPDIAKGSKYDHVGRVSGHTETGETITHRVEARSCESDHRDEAI